MGTYREVKFISCKGLVSNTVFLYTAVFHNQKTLHFSPEKLKDCKDLVNEFETGDMLADIVHVYDVKDRKCEVYDDIAEEYLLITC